MDQHLEQGVSEAQVDRWVQSACLLCSNGCGADIAVKDGRMVGIRGRAGDTVNHGRLGPKGLYGSTPWASSPDRLTRPLIRQDGRLVETDWETAMGRIVEVSQRLLQEKGPLSHGFYTSGQLFLEEYFALAVIGKAGLGTPHMGGNTRLCTATSAAAFKESFGADGQPGSYIDIEHCDAIFLFGHNMPETQTVLWARWPVRSIQRARFAAIVLRCIGEIEVELHLMCVAVPADVGDEGAPASELHTEDLRGEVAAKYLDGSGQAGPIPQFVSAGGADLVHPLVGPVVLLDDGGGDNTALFHSAQDFVDLLVAGPPDMADRYVEAAREVIARGGPLGERDEDRVFQRHADMMLVA